MPAKSFSITPERLIRLLLLAAALLLVLLLVLTVLHVVAIIPKAPDKDDPAQSTDSFGGQLSEPSEGDGITLATTPDAGVAYQDSLIFVGDSLTANLINRGVLTGGTQTRQVWRSESGLLNLNTEVTAAEIIFPGTGEPMTIAEAADKAEPTILVITLGAEWGVANLSEADFTDCYTKLVKAIQKASPKTTIVLQSIFPVSAGCASLDNAKIDTANRWVRSVAAACECYYLDTQSVLKDENNHLKEEFSGSSDGIHLNQLAYETILGYIRTHAVP